MAIEPWDWRLSLISDDTKWVMVIEAPAYDPVLDAPSTIFRQSIYTKYGEKPTAMEITHAAIELASKAGIVAMAYPQFWNPQILKEINLKLAEGVERLVQKLWGAREAPLGKKGGPIELTDKTG